MNAGFVSGLLALGMSFLASSALAALRIEVDKSAQTLTVTRDGETLYTWPVSTGKSGYATPSGNFTVFRMEAEHYSKEWDMRRCPIRYFSPSRVMPSTAHTRLSGLGRLRVMAACGWPLRMQQNCLRW